MRKKNTFPAKTRFISDSVEHLAPYPLFPSVWSVAPVHSQLKTVRKNQKENKKQTERERERNCEKEKAEVLKQDAIDLSTLHWKLEKKNN